MNPTKRASSPSLRAAVVTLAAMLGVTLLAACASNAAMVPDPDAPHTESAAASSAPCGPSDCTPCDEIKQKCMGPSVCGGHAERASRQCKRDTDGRCKDMIVCAP